MLAKEKDVQRSKEELLQEIDRLKKELEEREKLAYYKDLFENSSEMIYVYSFDMKLLEVNNAVIETFGYSRKELIGTNGNMLSADEKNDYQRVREKLEEVKKTGKSFTHDWWVKTREGKIFPTEFDIRISTYDGQEVFILMSRDISQRIEYEQELLRSRKQYKNLFERNLAGIYRTKMNGEIVDCNNAFATILGYASKDELIGKINAIDLYEDKGNRERNIQTIIKNQSVRSSRIRLLKKDKTPIWVLISPVAIKSKGSDEIDHMEGTFIDITDQVKVEEMLKKSQESYRLLLDSSPFGIVLHDEGQIVFANKKAVEMMGLEGKDFSEFSFFDYIREKEITTEASGISYKECKLKRKDGKEISVEIQSNKIDFQGKLVAQISIHDISQIKQLEKEKLQAKMVQEINENLTRELAEKTQIQNKFIASEEKLKASLMEKEVLLKEVHHRVKNNLQVISSIFNLQKNYSSNPVVRDMLVESQNRIKSMAFIHESLYKTVDFARINFSEYAENLCYNLVKSYNSYGKTAELELKLQEVFLNLDFAIPCGLILNELITNAIKYAFEDTEDEGVITVTTSREKQNVRMVIKDNGKGLPEDIDFKDSNTLGFQLVNALVTQINGKIKLTVENGTEYEILFALK